MIEDIEEAVLGSRGCEVLDIVHDKDVYPLVEGYEIHYAVAFHGIHILGLEFIASHVKNHLIREILLNVYADSLGDVSLSKAGASEEEQRIERSLSRRLGYAFSRAYAHLVAVSFHKIAKAVGRIEA